MQQLRASFVGAGGDILALPVFRFSKSKFCFQFILPYLKISGAWLSSFQFFRKNLALFFRK